LSENQSLPRRQRTYNELILRNELMEAFLANREDDVFPSIAVILGKAFPPLRGVVAWAESWGTYSVVIQGGMEKRTIQADQWARLGAGGGWKKRFIRLEPLELDGIMVKRILAVPIKEMDAAVGFVGLAPPGDRGIASAAAMEMLERVVRPITTFTIERINASRRESMRLMTQAAFAQSERRFQDFVEGSKDMIYIADSGGAIVLVNKAGEDLLARTRSEILGQPFASFCTNASDRDYFNDLINAEGYVTDFEITLQKNDGSIIFVTETATAVKNAGGEIVEIHGIVRDITERIKSQREMWRVNMELTQMNETLRKTQAAMIQQEKLASIGQLAAGIAHEINNPLGFLISDFQSLKTINPSDAHYSEDLSEIFGEMDDGFSRISEIVKNLGSFARSSESADRSPYDLCAGVKRALVIARNEIKYVAEVELRLEPVPSVSAIPGEIDQVLLNILVNAAHAIGGQERPERGSITVATGREKDRVWVEISDDGPGIKEEVGKRIFEPFFTTKEPGIGTGLGLSISYDIVVRKHGGALSYSSPVNTNYRRGEGTLFRIELPID